MKKKVIICFGGLLIILCLIVILLFIKEKSKNPLIIELQKQIEEQVGPEFKIVEGFFYQEEPFTTIELYSNDKQFYSEDVFVKIDAIQQIIYTYARNNKQYFEMTTPNYNGENGFTVYFVNTDEDYASSIIFGFSNYIEEDAYSDSMVSAIISADGGYPYKLSHLKYLHNIKELNIFDFTLDDENVLGQMENLKYLYISQYRMDEKAENIEKAAKKYGIVLD